MPFNSLEFSIFFLIYFFVNLFVSNEKKNYLVIFGSSIFYVCWRPKDLWIPYLLIFIAFFGYQIIKKQQGKKRFLALISVLVILYTPLLIFKYSDFIYNEIFSQQEK